jgi:hypothetical protein
MNCPPGLEPPPVEARDSGGETKPPPGPSVMLPVRGRPVGPAVLVDRDADDGRSSTAGPSRPAEDGRGCEAEAGRRRSPLLGACPPPPPPPEKRLNAGVARGCGWETEAEVAPWLWPPWWW